VAHAMVPGRRPRRRAPTEGDGNGSSATMTLVDTRGRQGGVGRRVPARRRCDRPRGSLPRSLDAWGRHVFSFSYLYIFPVFFVSFYFSISLLLFSISFFIFSLYCFFLFLLSLIVYLIQNRHWTKHHTSISMGDLHYITNKVWSTKNAQSKSKYIRYTRQAINNYNIYDI
jgi:hypothetical protein